MKVVKDGVGRRGGTWLSVPLAGVIGMAWLAAPADSPPEVAADPSARLAQMSHDELEQLRACRDRFAQLSPEEQQRMRELHAALQQHPDRERLERLLDRFTEWLATLRPNQRAELLELPAEGRIEKIRELRAQERRERIGMFGGTELTHEDRDKVLQWIDELVADRLAAIEKAIAERAVPPSSADGKMASERALRAARLAQRALAARGESRGWLLLSAYVSLFPDQARQLITVDDVNRLRGGLSRDMQRELDSQGSPEEQREVLQRWIRTAIRSRPPSDEELQQFFETLPAEDRQRLDDLSPDSRRRVLTMLYFGSQGFGGGRRPPSGDGPPDFDGPRRPPFPRD
jgi:hypothetical protein